MCGRYYIAEEDSAAELQEIIEQLNRRGAEVKTGEIYPTDTVPVLANNKSMVITPFAMKWGYTLPDGKQIINARSETAADKPLFRDGMLQRRCLIPATNYFEWEKRIRYNKLRKFQNRRIENSPQNKGQGQRHLVE